MNTDTIAAVATPPGLGGVGVIRISGPGVRGIAQGLFGEPPPPRRAVLRKLRDAAGRTIDQALILYFPGPASFTGDDCLELQGHGGPVVLDLLLDRCIELGARLARPGEFTQRAFLNGKLDLLQAEATADLIGAATATAARLAMNSLQGAFSQRIASLVEMVTELRVILEATLDFPDEQIADQLQFGLAARLNDLITSMKATISEAQHGERIREGLTVVIAGRPNAGKSSLLNALVQYDAAIVTPLPGTTRDLLRCDLQLDGLAVRLVDTAGIRDSDDLIEREGVRRARSQLRSADLVLWVYDAQLGLEPEELSNLDPQVPVTLIRNKQDLVAAAHADNPKDGFTQVSLSAMTGHGIAELRDHLRERAGFRDAAEGSFIARRRHLEALNRALRAAEAAVQVFNDRLALELVALDLAEAQEALGEITGDVTVDDLLARIFSTFCIGK